MMNVARPSVGRHSSSQQLLMWKAVCFPFSQGAGLLGVQNKSVVKSEFKKLLIGLMRWLTQ